MKKGAWLLFDDVGPLPKGWERALNPLSISPPYTSQGEVEWSTSSTSPPVVPLIPYPPSRQYSAKSSEQKSSDVQQENIPTTRKPP